VPRLRLRLGSLWVSQTARVLADWCLRVTAVLACATTKGAAWHLATAAFITPFIVLAPLNGCLSNGLPRRAVLVGSAAFTLTAVALAVAWPLSWVVCLGIVAVGAAVYSPARYAVLPAAARDTRLPLPRVNGWIEMGGAASIVGGAALGLYLNGAEWPGVAGVLLGLNVLCLLTALPVAFPSDVRRPEPVGRAVAGFFRDCRRILAERDACGSLLGLAGFQAVVTAGSGAVISRTLGPDFLDPQGLLRAMVFVGVGAALGCLAASVQGHPFRSLGLVSLGATGLLLALAWAALATANGDVLPAAPCLLLGFTGGLVNVPLRAAYLAAVPADARGNGTAVMNTVIYVLTTLLALLLLGLIEVGLLATPLGQLGFLALLAAAGAGLAWYVLFRPTLELFLELLCLPMYRIRAHGPGAGLIPARGPVLIVANHSSYADPFWLGKVVPRALTPMMTSVYFDLPVIRWLMVRVVHGIRVEATPFRREAPELKDAIAVLRRGGCLLIFPEARLRRTEGTLLRQFGQGVWRILRACPQTPVVVCWIEGGWGSYASYHGGPPMKDKPLDWGRHIDIAVAEPRVLDPAVLADQRATRSLLMRACLECRRYLGLEVPTAEGGGDEGVGGNGERQTPGPDAHQADPQGTEI
jgi:1-acyl-sn-glycerol-3-phosphate acyltransferase/MFS family permease